MSTAYPLRFAEQLRQHLKGLRKERGFTQAKLGQLLGVSQARIAEIEANPGLVNLDQLLQIFSALGVTLFLQEVETGATVIDHPTPPTPPTPIKNTDSNRVNTTFASHSTPSPSDWRHLKASYVTRHHVNVMAPNWHLPLIRDGGQQGNSAPVDSGEDTNKSVAEARSNEDEGTKPVQLSQPNSDNNEKPTARRNFVIRSKKGSW